MAGVTGEERGEGKGDWRGVAARDGETRGWRRENGRHRGGGVMCPRAHRTPGSSGWTLVPRGCRALGSSSPAAHSGGVGIVTKPALPSGEQSPGAPAGGSPRRSVSRVRVVVTQSPRRLSSPWSAALSRVRAVRTVRAHHCGLRGHRLFIYVNVLLNGDGPRVSLSL